MLTQMNDRTGVGHKWSLKAAWKGVSDDAAGKS